MILFFLIIFIYERNGSDLYLNDIVLSRANRLYNIIQLSFLSNSYVSFLLLRSKNQDKVNHRIYRVLRHINYKN